jgi:molybdopterin converting factor small subunit
MPVTAKLSRKFYEVFGDEIANELVTWFNDVDATYRSDLRELNELNFARFDAKVEQRLAELHAKLDGKIDRVAAELNGKIDRMAAELNAKIDGLDTRLTARIDGAVADLHAVLERRLGEQTRWLFVAWASLLIPIMGLWLRG